MKNRFKNEIRKKELNKFLIFLFIFGSIYGINISIANGLKINKFLEEGLQYIAYLPVIATSVNVFVALYFILYKKSIVGVWLFFALQFIYVLLSTFITPINNYAQPLYLGVSISKIAFVSLILLLRKNGESAWKTLMRKDKYLIRINDKIVESNEFNNEEQKPTAQIITYILTVVVVVLMIIAVIASI